MNSQPSATQFADNPIEKLHGSIERVSFHSEASGFCVLRVEVMAPAISKTSNRP
ncbi:MAG: hypothetical protein ACU836_05780 [Gammaproteobacteria bacterium]